MQHFLDVARIAYIISLEKGLQLDKDIIYAAALLHDIGRWKQYKYGIPHDKASAELAEDILLECGYGTQEIDNILSAILNHRTESSTAGSLEKIIFESDKLSRGCFNCPVSDRCNWSEEKKNINIKY